MQAKVSDLTPLKDETERLSGSIMQGERDLEPLKGMPLTNLNLTMTPVKDLEPLRGTPLVGLGLNSCRNVGDLSALKDMKLTNLDLRSTPVRDLTPLRGDAPHVAAAFTIAAISKICRLLEECRSWDYWTFARRKWRI